MITKALFGFEGDTGDALGKEASVDDVEFDSEAERLTCLDFVEATWDSIELAGGEVVDTDDDHAIFEARSLCLGAGKNIGNEKAFIRSESKATGEVRVHFLEFDAEFGFENIAEGCLGRFRLFALSDRDGVFNEVFDTVGGNGEANVFDGDVIFGDAHFRGVNADEVTVNINKRASAIARIDSGIGLEHAVVGDFSNIERAVFSAEDAGADTAFVADGIADRDDGLAAEIG